MEKDATLADRLSQDPAWMNSPLLSWILKNGPLIIFLTAIFLLYGYFLSHKIDLTTADLGRHIKNGEILLHNSAILGSNFYSYTNEGFEVLNHHWGSGLILYITWKITGFVGVELLFIILSLSALAFFVVAGKRYAGWGVSGLIAICVIPLLAERTEIRPEVFSYLFAGVFYYLLSIYRGSPSIRSHRWLWILPLVQIFWVNTHIYFLLGPLLIGAFLLESLILYRTRFFPLLYIWAATVAASLINPFGLKAITATFTFFENFGYKLAENQNVWFLERLGFVNPNFMVFKVLLFLLVVSFVISFIKSRRDFNLANLFIAGGIGTLAVIASRNMTIFGLFAIPLISANITPFVIPDVHKKILAWGAGVACTALLLSVLFNTPSYFPYWRDFGFGLEENNSSSIQFVRDNGVKGPIFNNYDIGGYLIFHLYPDEKVFVDNRPEAYPAKFFAEEYIPMQEDAEKWSEALEKYEFNAIVFSHRDATPWGQKFLTTRIVDEDWAAVYVDSKILIMVRRVPENSLVIEKHELPSNVFSVR